MSGPLIATGSYGNYSFAVPIGRPWKYADTQWLLGSPDVLLFRPALPGTPALPLRAMSTYKQWPVPTRVPWRPQDPTTSLDGSPKTLLPIPTSPGTVRAPVFTDTNRVPYPQDLNWMYTLNPNLQPAQAAGTQPFNQTSWPVPQRTTQLQGSPQNLTLNIPPPVAAQQPFSQSDWPVPKTLPTYFGWIDQGIITLVAGSPFVQTDWPLPRIAVQLQAFQQQNLTINLPAPVQTPIPFNQDSWPNPITPTTRLSVNPQYNLANIPPVNTGVPFNQDSWPVPIQPTYPFDLNWMYSLNLSLQPTAVVPDQPANTLWALPPRPVTTVQALLQNTTILLPPPAVAAAPFNQDSWPNPIAPVTQGQTWVSSTIALLNPPTPGFIPFNQYSWPVPIRAVQMPPLVQQYNNAFITPVNQNKIPPGVQVWMLPPRGPTPYQQQMINTPGPGSIPIPPAGKNFEWLARYRRRGRR